MPFFKNVFRSRDGPRSSSRAAKHADHSDGPAALPKPRWEESWSRKEVAPNEIQELIHVCTQEMKSRALDMPFLLLPFRPTSDPSAARNFVRNFFRSSYEGSSQYSGPGLHQELRLAEPLVLCSIMKWCWSRLPGGVVSWDAYELFRIGESDSNFARHAFDTFIPLSVDSDARKHIIFDFFDLLSAVAARGKTNGMGGRKLSRMAGWWAFEHSDDGKGFDGGYRCWAKAADAASHLFFAYLRSLSPDSKAIGGISALPRSLQALLSQTEYPPQAPVLMQTVTTKVVMIVDSVSPTPFALLRRAKHFEYRDDDEALQQFSSYEDPVRALTDECRRVLQCISSTNQSVISPEGGTQDASWSRFEDLGFSGLLESSNFSNTNGTSLSGGGREFSSLRSGPRSRNTDFGRPTTPSWADFLSSGFADENGHTKPPPLLLPPDKILPPIGEAARVHSSQSHMRNGLQTQDDLEPGELASITQFDLDDTFWWVWMTSLAGEESTDRKAAFGRCTLIETRIPGAKWLVIEEQVKGASPGPEEGAYIAEKKGRFSFTRRGRLGRRKSTGKKPLAPSKEPYNRTTSGTPMSKTSIGPDQHARIQAAAARLAQNQKDQVAAQHTAQRRARVDDAVSTKTNSVMTLQPVLMSEAAPAMKWDKKFGEGAKDPNRDRETIRAKYLGDVSAGKGSRDNLLITANGGAPSLSRDFSHRDLPSLPLGETDVHSSRIDAPSPAPLPATPNPGAIKSQRGEASSAAQVPLPNATPMALDEKVTEQGDYLDQHPALRKPVPERKPVGPSWQDNRAAEGQPSTSEAAQPKKPSPKKLKKNAAAGGGGFRKFFGGKKKADTAISHETATHLEGEAGLQSPDSYAGDASVQPQSHHSPVRDPSPTYSIEKQEPLRARSPVLEPSADVSAVSQKYHEPARPAEPSTNTREQRDADQAFSRFDQGPMDDMPAFVPDDDSDDDEALVALAGPPLDQAHQGSYRRDVHTPTQEVPAAKDDVSEESIDLTRQVSPSQDRWAQIRKNAAERAARLSEEQSRRSQSQSARTDEGETSGEETIESRVARIKARVAELTGNIEGGQGGAKR
ncbi:uncharacterized protein BDR25DRAFT_344905 [Lindgomyces ingoldianus]|uniref:Uncharacterized protein n=1 Tax=Lindgomyces ingoldianus TaxID=673940 RepID=A0ACB6QKX2_9PLEO|nr:uncharacterized protein BDR25DRAFT_344905 [Lindgomyces ingoldianus]KAF2467550.1 hypothetical protein BDR25DRAFT_344905 [Lindgomyces ingoldianus]